MRIVCTSGSVAIFQVKKGKLALERKMRPAVGPEMRDCGMRKLPVMSPHAFLGYEFSPAVAS